MALTGRTNCRRAMHGIAPTQAISWMHGIAATLAISCLSSIFCLSAVAETPERIAVAFKYAVGHVMVVPVKICGQDSLFILDTGSGVNLIGRSLADKLVCKASGKYSGRRMSGQKLTM